MTNIKNIVATSVATTLLGTSAFAGGLDRATFSPALLFEDGTFGEATLAVTMPRVSPSFAPPANVANEFKTLKLSYKTQLSDKFAIGMIVNNQPMGADIDYALLGSPLRGEVKAVSTKLLGHYQISDRVSAYGGLNHIVARGDADLTPSGLPEATNFSKDSGTGFIVGAAYEIPDIALRVSLSYESQIEFELDTVGALSGTNYGKTSAASPEAYTLEFQSGIAENTLLFGSVRHAMWEDSNIILPAAFGSTPISDFDDTTSYSLGLGRKFTDSFSMAATLAYEEKTGDPASPLAPTDGIMTYGLGGSYVGAKGVKTSLGISYSKRGDTTTTVGIPFADNEVITLGLKVSKNF